uniref:Uncharacterized protein n=1 Tax=Ciona savignyi TaxID=51511 RepID=H2Y3Z4_CIOSA
MNDANQMQTSLPTFVFLRNKPTFSDNGVYTLRIKNDKFEVDFNFNITVLNITAPVNNPPPPNNLGVIIGAACGGVVLLILIVVLVYCIVSKQRNKTPKGKLIFFAVKMEAIIHMTGKRWTIHSMLHQV